MRACRRAVGHLRERCCKEGGDVIVPTRTSLTLTLSRRERGLTNGRAGKFDRFDWNDFSLILHLLPLGEGNRGPGRAS